MKKGLIFLLVFVVIFVSGLYLFLKSRGMEKFLTNPQNSIINIPKTVKEPIDETGMHLKIPNNYKISMFAKDLNTPRDLELDPNGKLLVSDMGTGKIYALPEKKVVVEGLSKPHGIAFYNNKLYVAETNQISVFDYDLNTHKATNKSKILDLPTGGNHITRSIVFKDNKLYVSIGSTCNVCEEKDDRRAAIWVANPDGSDFRAFAKGLRNSVFMTVNPKTKEIWATEMGRDLLGDNTPSEEVNIIKEDGNYGWPYCYDNKIVDKETNPNNKNFDCNNSIAPHLKFQAHSAPLGLAFLGNDLLVAYHGSWNRTQPTGYKIVKFQLDSNGNPKGEPEDFVTGWLQTICASVKQGTKVNGNGCESNISGRPADILVDGNSIYISDDKSGLIYLVEK